MVDGLVRSQVEPPAHAPRVDVCCLSPRVRTNLSNFETKSLLDLGLVLQQYNFEHIPESLGLGIHCPREYWTIRICEDVRVRCKISKNGRGEVSRLLQGVAVDVPGETLWWICPYLSFFYVCKWYPN